MGSRNTSKAASFSPKMAVTRSAASRNELELLRVEVACLQQKVLDLENLIRSLSPVACQVIGDGVSNDCVGVPVLAKVNKDVVAIEAVAEGAEWHEVPSSGRQLQPGPRRQSGDAPSIPMVNRFAVLGRAGTSSSVDDGASQPTTIGIPEVVLMGDSLVRGVRVRDSNKPVNSTTYCYPGVRVQHLTAQVKHVLGKVGPCPVVVMHVGANNVAVDSPGQLVGHVGACVREIRRLRPQARV